MKNIVITLFVFIALSACSKSENGLDLDQIHGKWFVFSEERVTANGVSSIDTINDREEYFEFRADKSFLSTADGTGFYEISSDSLYINFRRDDHDDFRRFGFKYNLIGEDLALSEGRVTLHMKRL